MPSLKRLAYTSLYNLLRLPPKIAGNKGVAPLTLLSESIEPVYVAKTKHGPVKFLCPNAFSYWRGKTLLTKEPETIEWIDGFEPESIFWDIGANVGVYTLYAALKDSVKTLAFEPSAANYYVLNKNIQLNGKSSHISAFCLAFSDGSELNTISLSSLDVGAACNSFAAPDSKTQGSSEFIQGIIGYSIDAFVSAFSPPFPNYVKIDVDGIEPRIIEGGKSTFSDSRVKSILVEMDSSKGQEVEQVTRTLGNCGFKLASRRHSQMFERGEFTTLYNYIFLRG